MTTGLPPGEDASYPDLSGRVAVITGGAVGLGLAMGTALARQGARVLLADINEGATESSVNGLVAQGLAVAGVRSDVTDDADVAAMIETARDRFGPVDILVNNAGMAVNMPSLELTMETWQRGLDVMLTGAWRCTRTVLPEMIGRGRGAVLNISSLYGYRPAPERLAYCVAKAGIKALTEALAMEFAPKGLRINGIAPGYAKTDLVAALVARGRLDEEALKRRTPSGRIASVNDIAKLALFLLSDQSAHINGQVVLCDGGWTVWNYL